ncbi:MAG: DUF4910 domain-containing protein [Spirochaetes bacterium]|nr:DUF4910 domain-containing protein [Spirochaetota bacterium]
MNNGKILYDFCKDLWPICRSLTGNGVRKTLNYIKTIIPINIHQVKSGTPAFDWNVPKEWNIREAYIIAPNGDKIADFHENNLHVVGYSIPVNKKIPLEKLQEHLYSLDNNPDAIPFITSYYKERWGFCMTHNQRKKLKKGIYTVVINSELKKGYLTYADLVIKGRSDKEVLLSTYICHPSMANNELSGPAVATYIGKWLMQSSRKYTYRIVFIPETIGSLVYLSKHLKHLKEKVIAGYILSCLGDDKMYSWMPSRTGTTYSDKIAKRVLEKKYPGYKTFSYLERGSDERQYCSPGIDLPVASLFRSKYDTYPEYHTSLDNLNFITPNGLNGGFQLVKDCIKEIEKNSVYTIKCLGEPQLGKHGLYPDVSTKDSYSMVINMINLLAYADGTNDLPEICKLINSTPGKLLPLAKKLSDAQLIDIID